MAKIFKRKKQEPKIDSKAEQQKEHIKRKRHNRILQEDEEQRLRNEENMRNDALRRNQSPKGNDSISFKKEELKKNDTEKSFLNRQLQANTQRLLAAKVGKKIPILGAAIAAKEVTEKLNKGDYKGAILAGVSGAVAQFPGVGTAGSIAIDMYAAKGDEGKQVLKTEEIMQMKQKGQEVERLGFLKILDLQMIEELLQITRAQTAEAMEQQNQQRKNSNDLQNRGIFAGAAEAARNTQGMSPGETKGLGVEAREARRVDSSSLRRDVEEKVKKETPSFMNISKQVKEEMSKMRGSGDFSEERPKGHPDLVRENKAMGHRSEPTMTMEEVAKMQKV